MEELRNLQNIYNAAKARFNEYMGKDFILPNVFKEQVKEINNNSISYNDYSAIIETRGNQNGVLNIYLPNQWFYIASYFTDFYNELQRYKKEALKVTTKERLKELNGSQLNESEKTAIAKLDLSDTSKEYLIKFITDYNWWSGAKTIDRGDFYVSPILSSAQLVNASQSFVADLCAFLADKQDLVKAIINGEETNTANNGLKSRSSNALQQIFYGAPGTGKSFAIKEQTEGEDVIRTTFHPDTDYSTFVGSYKPTTKAVPVISNFGGKAIKVRDENGNEITEDRIVYEFVNQAFLQAYVSAWKKIADDMNKSHKQFLVIEEINRGNCAQIFGDLFQLLDRNLLGFSEYPIKADADMKKQLKKQLNGLTIVAAEIINSLYDGKDVVKQVLEGDILLLPNNLYIWATMNTSDQSLFPIDSAFKRRWDWQYVPIANAYKGWKIQVYGKSYDWWNFLEKVNALIGDTTNSEDKKLGYFFCKPENGIIDAETFVGKVIFYLWNDVFKDFEFDGDVFVDTDGETKLTFDKFYNPDATVREKTVDVFLTNLGVSFADEVKDDFDDEDQEDDEENSNITMGGTNSSNGRDYSKYSINGMGSFNKRQVPAECVKIFIQLNSEMSSANVIETWQALGIKKYFVENSKQHEERGQSSNDPIFDSRSYPVELSNGEIIYVDNQFGLTRFENFMKKVNAQDWGIHIEKIGGDAEEVSSTIQRTETHASSQRFYVAFPDGSVIEERTQFETYVEALKRIGLDKVEPIAAQKRYSRKQCALIDTVQRNEIINSNFSYVTVSGYHIVKGILVNTMVDVLNNISNVLNLGLRVVLTTK